ncbi:MAG: M14 family metallopeptidase [Myxococcota bacterium]
MGSDSSYLFSPPRMPFNPHRPSTHHAWEQRFARDQAHAFDENGWSYYTREWNEEFYAGYGSSWIIYLGAIGILYEQAGSMGQTVRQEAGTLLTYPDAVAHQATSSFANLDTLARHRAGILKDWLNGRRQAARPSLRSPKAYIIRADRYPDRANTFVNTLQMLNIDVLRAEGTMRMNDLTDFYGRKQNVSLPPGTIAVPLDQPNARLIRNILDFHLPMEAAFLREQRAYLEKEKGSRLYETTAWALPHAYALTTYWTTKKLSGRWKPASANTQSAAATETQPPKAPKYGFLINGQTDAAVQLAGRLLAQGLALRVAREPTSIQGRRFERGSILVKNEGNPKDLPARLAAASAKLGIEVFGVDTGLATRGTDLGGDNFTPIIAPRVAIIAGDPIRPDAFGFVWHLLDERAGLRLSRLNMARLMSTDLARYNVIVVPHSFSAGALRARLGKATFEKLKAWVDAGGTLIGLGNGAEAISHPDSTMTKSRFRRHVLDQYPPVVFGLDPTVADEAGRLRAVGLRATQKVDPKNPKPSTGWSDERRPYHVPPVIGPGARAFMTSSPAPFAWPAKRTTLDAWTKTLGPKDDKAKKAFLSRADARLRRFLPSGAYLSAQTDDDHWLNYGVERRLPVHFSARDALIAEAPAETAVRFENVETLHLGGLLWPEAAGRLAKTAYLVRETQGRGQVILFASDPAFRGSAFGTQRLLLNAIIWGPGLGTAWVRPW